MNAKEKKELKEQYQLSERDISGMIEDIGVKLQKIRTDKGLSQKEVSDIIGISRAALSYYESGQRTPDIAILYRLCRFYEISIDYLMGMKDTPEPQYSYSVVNDITDIGLTTDALNHLISDPDLTELINDLLCHKDLSKLEELTHHSRYTRYESVDAGYRSFLTSQLLYSMISEIYEKWYVDNDEKINTLPKKEKEKLLANIQKYSELSKEKRNAKDSGDIEKVFDLTEEMELLYRKLKLYI